MMVAVSSFKPLAESEEIARNQIRAKATWNDTFDAIILFGKPEPQLASWHTEFIDLDDFPKLSLMSWVAAQFDALAVSILNADIVLAAHTTRVLNNMFRTGAFAVTSRRFEYDPHTYDLGSAKVVDSGVDFFAATPEMWRKIAGMAPECLRIGHSGWDSWMLGAFNYICPRRFFDITKHQCIFHPRHGSRRQQYTFSTPEPPGQSGLPRSLAKL